MTHQQPDPPLTLQKASERFSQFLASNGYPSRIRWITADQILLGDNRQHFIRAEGSEEAFAEAQRRYTAGLKSGVGIVLQAICATPSVTIASAFIPLDEPDAKYRGSPQNLKLSCPVALIPASIVENPVEWGQLELDTHTRSEMLRDIYNL